MANCRNGARFPNNACPAPTTLAVTSTTDTNADICSINEFHLSYFPTWCILSKIQHFSLAMNDNSMRYHSKPWQLESFMAFYRIWRDGVFFQNILAPCQWAVTSHVTTTNLGNGNDICLCLHKMRPGVSVIFPLLFWLLYATRSQSRLNRALPTSLRRPWTWISSFAKTLRYSDGSGTK